MGWTVHCTFRPLSSRRKTCPISSECEVRYAQKPGWTLEKKQILSLQTNHDSSSPWPIAIQTELPLLHYFYWIYKWWNGEPEWRRPYSKSLRAVRLGIRLPVGARGYSSPHSSMSAMGPSQLPVNWGLGAVTGDNMAKARNNNPPHLAPSLRMSSAIHVLPYGRITNINVQGNIRAALNIIL